MPTLTATARPLDGASPSLGRFPARLSAWLAGLVETWRRGRRIRADAAYLRRLDDRMLADVGLTRGEIEGYVRHGRRHAPAPSHGRAGAHAAALLPFPSASDWR